MKKILLSSLFYFFLFFLFGETPEKYKMTENRAYRLMNSDEVKIKKQQEEYYSKLLGNVHFFYGTVECFSEKAFIFEKRQLAKLMGNVHIIDDSLEVFSQYAEYDKKNETFIFRNQVHFLETHKDSTIRTYDAQEITFDRKTGLLIAKNAVQAYDERQNIYAECGYMQYNVKESYGYMLNDPYLAVSGQDSLKIVARKIEYFNDYKKIVAAFQVVVWSEFFKTMSDFLLFYPDEEKAVVLGSPRFYSEFGDASAQEMVFYFENQTMKQANLTDSCLVVFSTEEKEPKYNWVRSDEMLLKYENENLSDCYGFKNVRSYLFSKGEKEQERMFNRMNGEELILHFDKDQYIQSIEMKKKVDGNYKFVQ